MAHCLSQEKRRNEKAIERKKGKEKGRGKEEERVQSDRLKDRLKHPPKTVSKRFGPTI